MTATCVHRATVARSSIVVAFVLLSISGCRPREGARCSGNTGTCTNGQEALWCIEGHFARVSCQGPGGCRSDGTTVRCDQSRGHAGETCLANPDDPFGNGGAACSTNGSQFLRCSGGRFVMVSDCDGPNHCTLSQQGSSVRVHCDESLASVGQPCQDEGGACSEDHSEWLHCQSPHGDVLTAVTLATEGTSDSVWTLHRMCRGPNHCSIDGTQLHCDESIGAVGDACDGEGAHACSADGNELVCTGGLFARSRACPGPRHCFIEGRSVFCDGANRAPQGPST